MDYFDDIEKQKQLKKILDEWIGTPFRHRCGVKKLGCDCIFFVGRIFEEMGLMSLNADKVPVYPKDWHIHNTRELVSEAVEKYLNVKKVGLTELRNGDIILSHYGRAASHGAIYFEKYVYQAITSIGVCKIKFEDIQFKKNMKFAYRLLK